MDNHYLHELATVLILTTYDTDVFANVLKAGDHYAI